MAVWLLLLLTGSQPGLCHYKEREFHKSIHGIEMIGIWEFYNGYYSRNQ
jgi:hypothetical protein